MKNFGFLLAVCLVAVCFSACKKELVTSVATPAGYFENDYNAAMKLAQDSNMKMFIHFYADWCSLCADFKRDVLNDGEVQPYMNENFVGVLMDAEKGQGKELFIAYGLTGHPNMIVTDKNGNLLGQQRGKLDKTEFLEWIAPFE